MTALSLVSDKDLLDRMPRVVLAERGCTADVIQHLMEIDRRRLYLDAACRSLSSYCTERLGYSEDEANKRVRVAQVARRIPQVIDELRSGGIHLTGVWLLAPVLTEANQGELLASARGKTRRQIEALIVKHSPKPDLPERVCPEPQQVTIPAPSRPDAPAKPARPAKVEPLSESRWSVQLSIGTELKAKIEEARQLLSHSVPKGDLATLIERAFDALLVQEKKRRFGAGKPRKRRLPKPGSRHIPVELVREITERDAGQCTFVDENGTRCSAREQLTIEHRHPFALGGATTADNLCLLCAAHNRHTARKAFGEQHIEQKIVEAEYERTHVALCKIGFRDSEARKALATLKQTSRAARTRDLLVEALAVLVPAPATLTVRDSSRPRWPARTRCLSWDGIDHISSPARLFRPHGIPRGPAARSARLPPSSPSSNAAPATLIACPGPALTLCSRAPRGGFACSTSMLRAVRGAGALAELELLIASGMPRSSLSSRRAGVRTRFHFLKPLACAHPSIRPTSSASGLRARGPPDPARRAGRGSDVRVRPRAVGHGRSLRPALRRALHARSVDDWKASLVASSDDRASTVALPAPRNRAHSALA